VESKTLLTELILPSVEGVDSRVERQNPVTNVKSSSFKRIAQIFYAFCNTKTAVVVAIFKANTSNTNNTLTLTNGLRCKKSTSTILTTVLTCKTTPVTAEMHINVSYSVMVENVNLKISHADVDYI